MFAQSLRYGMYCFSDLTLVACPRLRSLVLFYCCTCIQVHFSNGTEKGTEGKRLRRRPYAKWTPLEYFDKTPSVPVASLGGDDTLFNVAYSSSSSSSAGAGNGTGTSSGGSDGGNIGDGEGATGDVNGEGQGAAASGGGGGRRRKERPFKGAWVPATVLAVDYDENLEPFYTIKV